MRELDLLLGDFLERGYADLDAAGREGFERLLEYPDAVLLEWLMGRIRPGDRDVARLVEQIRSATAG